MNEPITLQGRVIFFSGRGRSLGYPTANIKSSTNLADGIYFGLADLDTYQNHPAIIFIGKPTTLGDNVRRVEAYLLDIPDRDYYEHDIRLKVNKFHRPNQKFADKEELMATMKKDEKAARNWFKGLQK